MKLRISAYVFVLAIGSLSLSAYAITNGQKISEESSTQIVKLSNSEGTCTGVVVGPSTVLTARHCTGKNIASQILVNGVPAIEIKVPTVEIEPESDLDLALLKLSHEMPNVIPIRRSPTPETAFQIQIVGYGGAYDSEGNIDWADVKRVGKNVVLPGDRSKNPYFNIKFELGAYNPNLVSGALPGDSGGPMLYNRLVIGISSKSMFGISNYTNLRAERALKFFSEATREGWIIQWAD